MVSAGLRCIVSNQDKWYLDHLDALWQGFYMNEPFTNMHNLEQQKLILGGEVCMWGEHIDASDIVHNIYLPDVLYAISGTKYKIFVIYMSQHIII